MQHETDQDDMLYVPFPATDANLADDRTRIERYILNRFFPNGMLFDVM